MWIWEEKRFYPVLTNRFLFQKSDMVIAYFTLIIHQFVKNQEWLREGKINFNPSSQSHHIAVLQ